MERPARRQTNLWDGGRTLREQLLTRERLALPRTRDGDTIGLVHQHEAPGDRVGRGGEDLAGLRDTVRLVNGDTRVHDGHRARLGLVRRGERGLLHPGDLPVRVRVERADGAVLRGLLLGDRDGHPVDGRGGAVLVEQGQRAAQVGVGATTKGGVRAGGRGQHGDAAGGLGRFHRLREPGRVVGQHGEGRLEAGVVGVSLELPPQGPHDLGTRLGVLLVLLRLLGLGVASDVVHESIEVHDVPLLPATSAVVGSWLARRRLPSDASCSGVEVMSLFVHSCRTNR
jgi:hypothetical protein